MDVGYVLQFLEELQNNNSKAWMDAHRGAYQQAKGYFRELVGHLLTSLQPLDPALAGTTAAECLFRINKNDFSRKGEAPYKGHFGAGISPGGRHSPFANYVLVLEPGNRSRVGGGIRKPSPRQLEQIREEIDYSPGELESILKAPAFCQVYGTLQGAPQRTAPKGYNKTHPAIELLKYKGYQVLHFFTDEEVLRPDFVDRLLPLYRQVKPLHDFLNRALTHPT